MTILRLHMGAEQPDLVEGSIVEKTGRLYHEVRCGMCGKIGWVDEEMFVFLSEAIDAGLDSPFKCAACEEEYDDLSYEG